ncbi:MAG TPA: OmpA family protein [Candidatus Competibacter sp.]|nr:OmpA family protein [Candidatus Competibacter sp.]
MTVSRITSFGLLALLIFIPEFFVPEVSAAPPTSGFNNKSNEDDGLDGVQGEIEQIITPEYRQRGMRVERMPDRNLRVLLPSEVMFAYDSADISRDFAPTLRQVARIMSNRPRVRARIVGHTDSDGSDSYNMDLSLRRAESVAAFIGTQGVERRRLHTEGRGEQEPIASNATPQGRQQNRRVELILIRPQRGDRPRRNQP